MQTKNSSKFSKVEIQNYLINRSFLVDQAKNISQVLNQFKCIQVDPINVVARTHELSLWNRVKDFQVSDLTTALYQDRELFEYWYQLFSIIPIKYYPYFSARMLITGDWQEAYYKTHRQQLDATLDYIREHGVITAKDLAHLPQSRKLFSWTSGNSHMALLDFLWDTGKIMIHHRQGNQRYFDLTERILPNFQYADKQESLQFLLRSNFDYLGIVRKAFLNRNGYVRKLHIKELFADLLAAGEISKIQIDGVETPYHILSTQVEEIHTLGSEQLHSGLNILPPLDPLIIDRHILENIFDYKYTWEAYVPAAKRKFGYYGMPILYQGKFVGQIELRKDKAGALQTLNLESTVNTAKFKKQLAATVDELQGWVKRQQVLRSS